MADSGSVRAVAARRSWPWERLSLLAILLLSALLEFWHLDQLGTSNAFYAAAVFSMTQNLHAFFFNSLDPVGFVTIDKPPLGFWIEAISARLLGFSGFSILLPEALATVGSVAVVYHLIKRASGAITGLLAALMLAVVPISVAVGRNDTIDSLLVFTLLVAVWTGLKATERGSIKWLMATGAIVGLGFEIKMMEAYLVLPALGLLYLLGAPISRRRRVLHLGLAAAAMLAVSLAWPIAVDLTPADLRPWIDSTQDNSAISLALGYNGIQRLLGQNESVTQFLSGLGLKFVSSDSTSVSDGFGGGGMFNNGAAGLFRLFDQQLAAQASWLLPLSIVGLVLRARAPIVNNRARQTVLVFGTWLIAAGAFFSIANFFHSYYLVTLGPPVAALAAIGLTSAWQASRKWVVLPAVLLATALIQLHILSYYSSWSIWLSPIVLAGTVLGCGLLVLTHFRKSALLSRAGAGLAITALLVAPVVWSGYSTLYGSNAGIPSAGPQIADERAGGPGDQVSADLVSYLEDNQGSATYLAATSNSNSAASIILATGQPVMSLGGFSGGDPILTVDQFANLVASGQVRYVLVGGGGGPQDSGTSSIMSWVQANGTVVTIASGSASQTRLYALGSAQS
ncbi:MAG: glycosyltransferase family 39 protein [Chloroflexi bacterium]|nr:glycosyltransferase family 39 protein [Chloroflexota bacterium]